MILHEKLDIIQKCKDSGNKMQISRKYNLKRLTLNIFLNQDEQIEEVYLVTIPIKNC